MAGRVGVVISLSKNLVFWERCKAVQQVTQEGRRAVPFDITHDPENMDLLTDQGFANAIFHTCALLPGSGALSAPVCSTFVVVCPGLDSRLTC